jgi:zinc protease
MTKKTFFIWNLLFFSLLGLSLGEMQSQNEFSFPVSQYKLKNGLQVILSEENFLPLVSVVVAYNVGAIDELPGKTGLAYLLQNLMFQGSENISQMQHVRFINRCGGQLNATTTIDSTLFYQTVPSNQLALVLWLESDRMKSLDLNAPNVERAKSAIIEEIQQRKASEPYLESSLAFDKLLYPDFAYGHSIIGTEGDVSNITLEDAKNFYSTYYVPNNAVLCITGSISKAKTKELISKYFETIPRGKEIASLPPPKPVGKKLIMQTFTDSLAPAPGFHLGYRIAPPQSDDFHALTILDYLLFRGKSSRLFKRLFKKERIVSDFSGAIERRKNLAAYKIFAVNNNEIMVDRCQKAIFSELDKLKSGFVSEEELKKVKNMFKMDYLERFSISQDKAIFLCESHLAQFNLETLPAELDKYLQVTPTEIIGIANRYFTEENSVLLNIRIR